MSGDSVYTQENNLASIPATGSRAAGTLRVVSNKRGCCTTAIRRTMQLGPGREYVSFGTANAGDEFRRDSDGNRWNRHNRYPRRADDDTQKRWPNVEQFGKCASGDRPVLDRGPGLFVPVADGDDYTRINYQWNEHHDC